MDKSIEPPIVQALLVADHVWHGQGKTYITGVFHTIWKSSFPGSYPHQCALYVSLVNATGQIPLEIRFIKLDTETILLSMKPPVDMPDPVKSHDFYIPLPPSTIPLPEPGEYAFEILVDGVALRTFRITVLQKGASTT